LMFGINFLILSNSLRLSNSISTICPTITTLFVYKISLTYRQSEIKSTLKCLK
jgi:hypothetical protein